jgi:alpha-1,6-mannosyltransferase
VDQAVRARSVLDSPSTLSAVGLAGAAFVAAASYWVGAVPHYFRTERLPIISFVRIGSVAPRLVFYAGFATLILAWLRLCRLTLDGVAGTDWRNLRRIALRWTIPIALSVPLGSRDLWAYAAQGNLVRHGLDPYSLGPSALPGAFAGEVSQRWVDTPAPYGPLWLLAGRVLATVTGNHVTATVAVLRLAAVAGLLMLAYTLPALAERAGGRADLAVWLVVANPLVLVLGVGGGHNDILMIGLTSAGLLVATGSGNIWRTLVPGTALITCAVAIKSPAVVAVAFVVPLWLAHAPAAVGWRNKSGVVRGCLVAAATSIGVFAAVTAVSGLGLGWVKQINDAAPIVNWMSLPTLLAICWNLLHGIVHGTTRVDATMREFRSAGTGATLLVLAGLWFGALRWLGGLPTTACGALRRNPWALLATALLAVVILGPTVQPWYFSWSLAIAAVVVRSARSLAWSCGLSVALVIMIRPNGTGLQMQPVALFMVVGSLLLAWQLIGRGRKKQGPTASRVQQ